MSEQVTGTVKWFDNKKGYGFIERDQGDDVFVHYSEIKTEGYRSLKDGQRVEFNVTKGEKGFHAASVNTIE